MLFLIKGENETLEVDIDPDDATNTGVTWASDKPNIATVDEYGKVTAVELGSAKITATTIDGGMEAICWVKVVASESDIPVLGDSCVLYLDGSIGNDPTSDDYTWYDLSGKGNHGTLQGFDDENSGGWTKQGLKFDGVNDYVIKDVPDSFLEDGKHTVEIWCNPANLEGFRGFIEIADKNTVNNIRLGRIMSYDNVNTIRYHSTFIGGSPYQYIEAEIGLNKDVHLAGTFDGSKTILYINGVKVDEILGTDVPTFTEGQKAIFIGRDLYLDIERYFKGTIYGARIYNRALSPEEIAQNYASTDLQRSLKLNKAVLFLKNGTTADESLIATIEPDGTTPHDVTWTSDKPNIATVDEYGNVTAEALGTAKITATTMDGGKEAFCWVKVVSSDFVIDDSCVLYLDGRMGYDSTVKAWYDLSGEENHGTLWGFDDEGSSGWTEEGLEFDGVDDYVELADAASLNFTEGITIEAWIKPEDITGEHSIICKSYDSSGNGYELQIYNQELRYRVNQPTKHWASSTGIGLREDEWQHVAVTYDCEQVRFYKDGILINTLPVEGGLYNSTAPIEIGVYHNKEEDFFEGSICQVAVYNRALFLEEIARNYFAATNSEPLEPVVGAVLDLCAAEEKISLDPDGTGIWQDASENEQDATMYNVAFTEGDEAEDWPGLEFNGVNSYAEVTSDIDSYLTSDDSITLESFVTFKELDYENENGKLITMVKKGVPDKEEAHSGFALAYDNRNNGQIFKYTCFGNTAGGYYGGGNNFESVSRKLENNKAYHFVVTINDSDATLFIDGEPVLRKQLNNLDLTTEGSLFIGRWGAIYAPLVIHHLRIYDRALTDLEVLQNYLACIKRS
ncbi:MAG: LamG-like jellyroll fold domain-containing protein [Peptococcia bacterium]